ncbi:GGDEF domain-containing protein [Ruegeria sediminis]|uniref:GGDEF domain-containing protein n=2 Tax=Ruegeria sediminis TaxID=2583820 RepID=A0ABY2WT20_9RHOB|nr:bifunctional diguanylate cyclase/phosphodiesterase [Ruegeria sediminis]TMV03270.1 GGDEF domain-containing protein [Ruegeria sediminis]
MRNISLFTRFRDRFVPILTGPPILAFLPAVSLGAFWLGGETALLLTALGLPLLFAAVGALDIWPASGRATRDRVTGLIQRDEFLTAMTRLHREAAVSGQRSACFVIALDQIREIEERHGQLAVDMIAQRSSERITAAVRRGDIAARFDHDRFAVCLSPVPQLELEHCIQLAGRIQAAIEDPIILNGITVYVSCSVGFCLHGRAPGNDADGWLDATLAALGDAKQIGPSTIRAYSAASRRAGRLRTDLRNDIRNALDTGQIVPWFQPQVSTDTGKVTGFEALARWVHPTRGVLGPDTFLQIVEETGLVERLGQVIRHHALGALKSWDEAGMRIPRVSVNFAAEELRSPGLVDRIQWELDRVDLRPDRLCVEILETVFDKAPDDVIARNVAGLAASGCRIDLDDFGTGHASIASLRRFDVSRIKIDRSFVKRADRDPKQQQLVGAILTMAEQLNLETLAEGVETTGEHALLAQLGCGHVQGFGIAGPMPFEHTLHWIAEHEKNLGRTPSIGHKTG